MKHQQYDYIVFCINKLYFVNFCKFFIKICLKIFLKVYNIIVNEKRKAVKMIDIYELKEFLLDRLGSFDKGFCTFSKEYKEAQSDLIYEILEMVKSEVSC